MLAVEGPYLWGSEILCVAQVAPLQAMTTVMSDPIDLSLARVPKSALSAALEVTGIACIYPSPLQGQPTGCCP